jgi:hypothetical protein
MASEFVVRLSSLVSSAIRNPTAEDRAKSVENQGERQSFKSPAVASPLAHKPGASGDLSNLVEKSSNVYLCGGPKYSTAKIERPRKMFMNLLTHPNRRRKAGAIECCRLWYISAAESPIATLTT